MLIQWYFKRSQWIVIKIIRFCSQRFLLDLVRLIFTKWNLDYGSLFRRMVWNCFKMIRYKLCSTLSYWDVVRNYEKSENCPRYQVVTQVQQAYIEHSMHSIVILLTIYHPVCGVHAPANDWVIPRLCGRPYVSQLEHRDIEAALMHYRATDCGSEQGWMMSRRG